LTDLLPGYYGYIVVTRLTLLDGLQVGWTFVVVDWLHLLIYLHTHCHLHCYYCTVVWSVTDFDSSRLFIYLTPTDYTRYPIVVGMPTFTYHTVHIPIVVVIVVTLIPCYHPPLPVVICDYYPLVIIYCGTYGTLLLLYCYNYPDVLPLPGYLLPYDIGLLWTVA